MASTTIQPYGSATITVPASSAVASYGAQAYQVLSFPTYANYPTPLPTVTFSGTGLNTSSAFTNATTVIIQAGGSPVTYNVGTGPVLFDRPFYQPTVGTLNATGTLTAALMLSGVVTSTTAAAVTGTTDTAALIDAATTFAVGDFYDFSVVNTGGANAFTLAAGSSVTLVGSGTVAASSSARFRLVKTAATPTFSIYRLT